MKRERSAALFAQASQRMPGGVNSPVRSFAHVGEVPVFVKRAYGSRVEDEDGNVFIDYVGSWGPLDHSVIGRSVSSMRCMRRSIREQAMGCLRRQRARWRS